MEKDAVIAALEQEVETARAELAGVVASFHDENGEVTHWDDAEEGYAEGHLHGLETALKIVQQHS